MTWTTNIYDTTNSAEDVNTDFQHIRSGNMIPFTQSAAGTLTAADNTYDLGSSTYRWKEIHVQNLDIASGGRVENSWNLISEITLNETAATITFSITSSEVEIYHIIMKGVHDATGLSYFVFNGDSGANYGYQLLEGKDAVVTAARTTGENYLYLGNSLRDTTTAISNFHEIYIYAKAGYERLLILKSFNSGGGTYAYQERIWGQIWNNTADTITTIKFLPPGNFVTNTTIQLWASDMTVEASGTSS